MKKLFNRLGCLTAIIAWLLLMSLPIFVCVLMSRGQITWGQNSQDQMRIFLLQEPGNEGVGFQWTRPANDDATCIRTTVRYPIMFDGEAGDSDNCTCMTANVTAENLPPLCTLPETQ